MALKAGRVGVNPADVDPIDGHISPSATGSYTKQEADAKFETQTHAAETYESKSDAAALQPKTLAVPIEMLSGSKLTVESALQGLNTEKFTYADNGVLGAKNYLNKTSAETSAGTITVTQQDTGVRIQSVSASTWGNGFFDITSLKKNTDYVISSDVAYTSGSGSINISGSTDGTNFTTITGTASAITSSGKQTVKFNVGNYSYIRIKLFVTMGTSETADISWNNLMLCLASDPDSTYQPYAMTNRELTEKAIVQEGTVTSDFTIANYSRLYKVGNIVNASLFLSGVTKNAFTDSLFNIPQGFRPKASYIPVIMNIGNDAVGRCTIFGSTGNAQSSVSLDNSEIFICATWVTD